MNHKTLLIEIIAWVIVIGLTWLAARHTDQTSPKDGNKARKKVLVFSDKTTLDSNRIYLDTLFPEGSSSSRVMKSETDVRE